MKKIQMIFLLVSFSLSALILGCDSQGAKEENTVIERKKNMFENWDKDVEAWKRSQEKPSKPYWDRR